MGLGSIGLMGGRGRTNQQGYIGGYVDAAAARQYGSTQPFGQQGTTGNGANSPYVSSFFPGVPGAPPAPTGAPAPTQTAAEAGQQFQIAGATGSQPGGTTAAGTGGTAGFNVAGAPAGTMSNTGEASPDVRYLIDQYKQRLGTDPTQRAIDMATSQSRDTATGMAKELGSDLARRGISNSGAGAQFLQQRVFAPAQRQAAGQAAGIALGRQGQLDQMVLGGTGLMRAPQELGLQERQLGLQQMDLQQRADIARAQLGLQAQNQAYANQAAQMNMLTSYLNLFR